MSKRRGAFMGGRGEKWFQVEESLRESGAFGRNGHRFAWKERRFFR